MDVCVSGLREHSEGLLPWLVRTAISDIEVEYEEVTSITSPQHMPLSRAYSKRSRCPRPE